MWPVKRIEILTGAQEFSLIEQVLERHGITGYMVLDGVHGKGNRQLGSVDPLTGASESRLIKTTCPPDRFDALVNALQPILGRYGGTCIVYDAESLILSHHYEPKSGAVLVEEP
jgi:hypothetical protein